MKLDQKYWQMPLIAVGYFLTGVAAFLFRRHFGMPVMFWLPCGFALGAFLMFGASFLPWLLLSSLALNFFRPFPLPTVFLVTLGHLVGPALGAYLFRRAAGDRPALSTLREVFLFLGLGVMVGPAVGSWIEVASLRLTTSTYADNFAPFWADWWMDEGLGALAVVPLWLTLRNSQPKRKFFRDPWMAFILGCELVMGVFCYTPLSRYNDAVLLRPYLFFPLVIWGSIRQGTRGMIAVLEVAAVLVVVGMITNSLPGLAGKTMLEIAMYQEAMILVLWVTGLTIAAALQEKEKALEIRDTFLSVASHELKTPLTSLKLGTQSITSRLALGKTLDPVRLESQLNRIDRQSDRLTRLVEDMLDISRISTGKLALRPEYFDIRELLSEVLDRVGPQLTNAGCEVTLSAPAAVEGRWDRIRLEQVLINLLTNAARHAHGKPVEIYAGLREGQAEIYVRDEGPGIPLADQAKIFQQFVQVKSKYTEGGLGLGLYIAHQLVTLHGGTLKVESEPGKGAKFTVRLPV